MEYNLDRVSYGKPDTPEKLREYRVREFRSSAIGTTKEITDFLNSNGITEFE